MYNSPFYVKFRPFDENTLIGLINQSIRFSTVYDFNDFSEFHGLLAEGEVKESNSKQEKLRLEKQLNEKLKNRELMTIILENRHHSTLYKGPFVEAIKKWHDQFEKRGFLHSLEKTINSFGRHMKDNRKEYWGSDSSKKDLPKICEQALYGFLLEHIIWASLGIFSLSHSDVFNSHAAMLMFAHYAKKAFGVALIYEYCGNKSDNLLHEINYLSPTEFHEKQKALTRSHVENIFEAIVMKEEKIETDEKEKVTDSKYLEPFLMKMHEWKYEHECRIFCKKGTHSEKAKDSQLKLKAILYTGRLSVDQQKAIKSLAGNMSIQAKEVFLGHDEERIFKIVNRDEKDKSDQTVTEWLKTLS